MMDEY
jgi:hypothetical protein